MYDENEHIQSYLESISKIPVLDNKEEVRLGRLIQEGNLEAKRKFCESNLKLVVSVAKKFGSKNFMENIQVGNLELIEKTIENWNPNLGYKFSTYAISCIEKTIIKKNKEKQNTTRYDTDNSAEIEKIKKMFWNEYSRTPTQQELMDITGWGEVRTKRALEVSENHVYSLEHAIESNKGNEPGFICETPLEKMCSYNVLNDAIDSLKSKKKDVIIRHNILEETLEEIGNSYGLSKERIRQIEENGIIKIRRYLKKYEIDSEDLL